MNGDVLLGLALGAFCVLWVGAIVWATWAGMDRFWEAFVDELRRSLIEHGWTPPKGDER